MIPFLAAKLIGAGVPEQFVKPIIYVGGALLAAGLLWAAIAAWKSGIIQDYVNEANVEFLEDKDEATGTADAVSDAAKADHDERVKKTGELIDEALKEGCVVSDYLASGGELCIDGNSVSGATSE